MTINEQIIGILEAAKLQIQANMQTNGINASGRSSKSFTVVSHANGVRLIMTGGDVAPAQTLENGLAPNIATWGIFGKIQNWIVDKKLTVRNVPYLTDREHKYTQEERNLRLAAGGITHKIIAKGTNRYTTPAEVIYTPVIEDVKKKILSITRNAIIKTIKDKQF